MSAKAALLQALTYPGHGFELITRIERRTGRRVRLNKGSVYPALAELERAGLVRTCPGPAARGAGRPARYYELTLEGIRMAAAQREAMVGLLQEDRKARHGLAQMQERLRRCVELSAVCRDLRRLGRQAGLAKAV